MDIISLGKASKVAKTIQQLDQEVVAPLAESRFPTVDARLDWIEGQANKIKAENSLQLDLSKGTFTDTEFINGKVQLKNISTVMSDELGNAVTPMTSSNTPSPYVVTASNQVNNYEAWKAFNGIFSSSVSTGWQTNTLPAWIQIDLGENKLIEKYTLSSASSARAARTWVLKGSIDKTNWITLDSQSLIYDWGSAEKKSFDIASPLSLRYFRLEVSAHNGDVNNYLAITEIELLHKQAISTYIPQGSYESPILDLGEGYNKTTLVDIVKSIHTGFTDGILEISTSSNSLTFSEYTALDPEAPAQGRYIKVRATLSSTPEPSEVKTYQFNQSAENKVAENIYTLIDGDIHLKTDYEYALTESTALEAGKVLRTTIPNSEFKKINTLEVV